MTTIEALQAAIACLEEERQEYASGIDALREQQRSTQTRIDALLLMMRDMSPDGRATILAPAGPQNRLLAPGAPAFRLPEKPEPPHAEKATPAAAKRKPYLRTAAQRKAASKRMKAHWAMGKEPQVQAIDEKPKAKKTFTAAVRKRMAAAQKKRWAEKKRA
jgi:hypothetical protein